MRACLQSADERFASARPAGADVPFDRRLLAPVEDPQPRARRAASPASWRPSPVHWLRLERDTVIGASRPKRTTIRASDQPSQTQAEDMTAPAQLIIE
jgi:hypothetical protein